MRRILWLLTLSAFMSCTIDSYEKGDGELSAVLADFVVAHVNADQKVDYVVTDDDQRLTLQSLYEVDWKVKTDSLYRAVLYYEKDGHQASPISLTNIPVVTLIPKDSVKNGMKTDPLTLESVWISKNKSFLNVGFYAKVGETANKTAVHQLGMVQDTLVKNTDLTRTLHLKVYHDQGGVPEYYSQKSYFCVALKDLTVDSIRFSMNTYQGEVVKTLSVK